jgi:hypothetical protein
MMTLLANGCPYAIAFHNDGEDTTGLRKSLNAIAEQSQIESAAAVEPQGFCDAMPLQGALCTDRICRPDFGFSRSP